MAILNRYQIPSIALIGVGIYVIWIGFRMYVLPESGESLGFLDEIVFGGFLFVGGAAIVVGGLAFRHERPVLPSALLVGLLALMSTFAIELYKVSTNTQLVVVLILLVTLVPALTTWAILRNATFWMGH